MAAAVEGEVDWKGKGMLGGDGGFGAVDADGEGVVVTGWDGVVGKFDGF